MKLTRIGGAYAMSAYQARRLIFADQLAQRIPVVAYVRRLLERHPAGSVTLAELQSDLQERYLEADLAPTLGE